MGFIGCFKSVRCFFPPFLLFDGLMGMLKPQPVLEVDWIVKRDSGGVHTRWAPTSYK